MILKIEELTYSRFPANVTIIDNVSFDLDRGETIWLSGASGAGKTTLLKLLNRTIEPTRARIELDRRDWQKISNIELRRQILLVPATPKLLEMTVAETLAYPAILRKKNEKEIVENIAYWQTKLAIPSDWLPLEERQLNDSQKQLVCLARGFICQSPIVLLDRPFNFLDPLQIELITSLIEELKNTHQISTIVADNNLDIAAKYADRLLYLQAGKLVANLAKPEINWQTIEGMLADDRVTIDTEW
jgi:D-methionine transport system ATP-binding protein